MNKHFLIAFTFAFLFLSVNRSVAQDILIADFESNSYGDWTVQGNAFGERPAQGTLPNQMDVSGYNGKGLVSSFYGGDGATGVLTSPSFTIERPFIKFLIGGGGYKDETCINLLIDGKAARTAVGPNTKPGGTERLNSYSWDVSDLAGQTGVIQIVDKRKEGWGHINIDQIVLSDRPAQTVFGLSREFEVNRRYLIFPIDNSSPAQTFYLSVDGEQVREMSVSLAPERPDFWVYLDLAEFSGQTITLRSKLLRDNQIDGFLSIRQDDIFPGEAQLYQEKLRPQFHFSSKRGWNNDPNGLVYYDGEYHLFYQHNPYGWPWGNMTWGHAVSTELVHWTEIGDALHPDELGTMFSGSAVVDWKNTTGFQTGDEPPLITIFTYAGGTNDWSKGKPFTQGIAYSNDKGRTWTKYEGNPVQGHLNEGNRDPKVIWWEETNEWVIVLYLKNNRMAFFRSPDLKRWELQSILDAFHECPELFQLPVIGSDKTKWVLYGGTGEYFVGDFDGSRFVPDGEKIRFHYGDCFYASQTYSDIPKEDGRRIQIAWGQGNDAPGMPFNQMMMFPVSLTLHETESGPRLYAYPVKEIETLYAKSHRWDNINLASNESFTADSVKGELFDINIEIDIASAKETSLIIRGEKIIYDAANEQLIFGNNKAPLKLEDGQLELRCIVDRTSIEIYANQGKAYMPCKFRPDENRTGINIMANGGQAKIESLEVHELKSIWK
ncbi:glycoside hydrolase family 32 protein [bacterium]|nr:glycoside hydrolase family 32 protein [bacterium]